MADMPSASANPAETITIPTLSDEESRKAAEIIQRTYRGHRARRQLRGFGLDAETRWYEVVKDAQYHRLTTPVAPKGDGSDEGSNFAKSKWRQATKIAQRAGNDDYSISEYSSDEGDPEHKARRDTQALRTAERKKTAKMMDLQYFLEMVDQKHRYGSNLRKYHAYWRTLDTKQNFFYWLDYGEGKNVDLEICSRARLEKMQVRYLSREERQNYLVKVDKQGRLVWAKNNERVWTKDELYKDSMKGIVPTSDTTPAFKYNVKGNQSSSDESTEDEEAEIAADEGGYANEEYHRARGPAKLKHVSAAVVFNHMVKKSLRKGHKWIFVADTSFRMYIGYKQSGAFQHSSFLHGSRILAAGVIKVKDGQIRDLAPLSGHYRPPTANFRAFVHALRDEGIDMSRVSISKSYAVLVGMEGYKKAESRVKETEKAIGHEVDKVFRPEKAKKDEEARMDKSKSAEKERMYLEQERLKREQEEKGLTLRRRTSSRLSRMVTRWTSRKSDAFIEERGIAGTGPEDGIPPPEGQR